MYIPNFNFLKAVLEPYDVRLVGGAVRDISLGLTPKDFDFSTEARPEIVMQRVINAGFRVAPTGLQHGTVTVFRNGEAVEITTLRIDKTTDGRRATIEYTDDWKLDASRRDFTFNAMSMDIDGKIYDYFGGLDDLKYGIVRFVGDSYERISEDYLRIMRFFRFHARIRSPYVDEKTINTISDLISGIDKISGERINNELMKILSSYNSGNVFALMQEVGLLSHIRIPYRLYNLAKFAEMNKIKARNELILASLFTNTNEVDYFYERVRITSKQNILIKYLVANQYTHLTTDNILRKLHHKESMEDLQLLAKFQGDDYASDLLTRGNFPKFPLEEADVSNLVTFKKNTRLIYFSLLDKWIESFYRLTRTELLMAIGECEANKPSGI